MTRYANQTMGSYEFKSGNLRTQRDLLPSERSKLNNMMARRPSS